MDMIVKHLASETGTSMAKVGCQ